MGPPSCPAGCSIIVRIFYIESQLRVAFRYILSGCFMFWVFFGGGECDGAAAKIALCYCLSIYTDFI